MGSSMKALELAYEVSPTGTVQQSFTKMKWAMEEVGETEQAVTLAILDGISDGLRHGNWPSA
jgi:hypothetical protein